jgi:hypothetical protein
LYTLIGMSQPPRDDPTNPEEYLNAPFSPLGGPILLRRRVPPRQVDVSRRRRLPTPRNASGWRYRESLGERLPLHSRRGARSLKVEGSPLRESRPSAIARCGNVIGGVTSAVSGCCQTWWPPMRVARRHCCGSRARCGRGGTYWTASTGISPSLTRSWRLRGGSVELRTGPRQLHRGRLSRHAGSRAVGRGRALGTRPPETSTRGEPAGPRHL